MNPIPGSTLVATVVLVATLQCPLQADAPTDDAIPGTSISAALVTGQDLLQIGSSPFNICWGRVLARGCIDTLGFSPPEEVGVHYEPPYHLEFDADHKALGAGLPDRCIAAGTEKWVRWQAGSKIFVRQGATRFDLFPPVDGMAVVDFFSQLMNGEFPRWNAGNTWLTGDYVPGGIDIAHGEGIYYDPPVNGSYTTGTGAFVQNWPSVVAEVDDILTTKMSYDYWKRIAIENNGYLRPKVDGTGFTDHLGNDLYVTDMQALTTDSAFATPMTSFRQITMKHAIPLFSCNTSDLPDQVLFVDTIEGTADGTQTTPSVTYQDDFFWKGLFYMNGGLSLAGGGTFPTVLMKDPDQFFADPKGSAIGTLVTDCFLDGILFVAGSVSVIGNCRIYGSMVYNGSTTSNQTIVAYNSRLQRGILPSGHPVLTTLRSGAWHESSTWEGAIVPLPDSGAVIAAGHVVSVEGATQEIASITNHGTLRVSAGSSLALWGGTLTNRGTLILEDGAVLALNNPGILTNYGTIDQAPTAKVVFHRIGIGQSVIKGDLALTNLELNSASLFMGSATLRILGTLEMTSSEIIGGSPSYAPGAKLRYHDPGDYLVQQIAGNEWPRDITVASGAPTEVIVDPHALVKMAGGQADTYHVGTLSIWGTYAEPTEFVSTPGTLVVEQSLVNAESNDPWPPWQEDRSSVYFEGGSTLLTAGPSSLENRGQHAIVRKSLAVSGPGALAFGLTGVEMNVTVQGTLAGLTVDRYDVSCPSVADYGRPGLNTGRYWDISAMGSGYVLALTLPHNGISDPYVAHRLAVDDWEVGRTGFTPSSVTWTSVTDLSEWTVGDPSIGNVPVRMSRFIVE